MMGQAVCVAKDVLHMSYSLCGEVICQIDRRWRVSEGFIWRFKIVKIRIKNKMNNEEKRNGNI